jgi:hypothetical protein
VDVKRSELPNPPANLLQPSTGAGGKVALASASIDGGLRWQFSSFEVPLVAGVEAGLFDSIGQNVPSHVRRSAAWLATYLGSGIGLQLTPVLAAGVRVEGLIALLRPEFALNHGNEPLVFYQPRSNECNAIPRQRGAPRDRGRRQTSLRRHNF